MPISTAVLVALLVSAGDGLERLTVPVQRLPKDCRLAPLTKDAKDEPYIVMGGGRTYANPWIGTRHPSVALIRGYVEGSRSDPEYVGPAGIDRLAKGTIDGYLARYGIADGWSVDVYAVRFENPALTVRTVAMRLDPDAEPRIVLGRTAVWVHRPSAPGLGVRKPPAAAEACHRAVRDYIAALK